MLALLFLTLATQQGKPAAKAAPPPVKSGPPHEVVKSVLFPSGSFRLSSSIVVSGSNLILDGNGATLEGTGAGIGLRIGKTQNVTIRNLHLKGFRWGIVAEGSGNLRLENVESSGNQNYFDVASVAAVADPEGSKEPDYGGGILLRQVTVGTVNGVQAHGEWNGVTLSGCTKVILDHCDLSKNDDTGLHLWNSHDNVTQDCRIDRVGIGVVQHDAFAFKGGDQAGILVEHDSSRNRFLRNAVVRCGGDGIRIRANELAAVPAAEAAKLGPLAAGDQPVLLPTHASDDNVFDGNDASFAEAGSAFDAQHCSGNKFLNNVAAFSAFGFALDFSRKGLLKGNLIVGNRDAGVRCDNGWTNAFESNTLVKDIGSPVAMSFSDAKANAANPNRGAQNRSGDVQIFGNTFAGYGRPFRFVQTSPATIQTNQFAGTQSAAVDAIVEAVGPRPLSLNNDPLNHVVPDLLMSLGNGAILASDIDTLGGISLARFAPNATEGIVQGSLTGRFDGEEYELGRLHEPSEITFPARAARYIRVVGAAPTTAAFVAELGDTSLALHHTADASSNAESADLAVDGDWCTPGRAWRPSEEPGQIWQVDLHRRCLVSGLAITAGDADPNAFWSKFHVVVSNTGDFAGEELLVATEADWAHHPGPIRQYTFPPTQGRFIRIVADVAQKGVQLQEVGVYGIPAF